MPPDVERALAERGLADAYEDRPDYQQNDYVGWIERAKRPETRAKRLSQMLDELEAGDAYMGMAYRARTREPPRGHAGGGPPREADSGEADV